MPKLITPTLILEGEDFLSKHGYRATVELGLGGLSSFSVSFQASATEGTGTLMDTSLGMIGKRMYIGLDDGAMEFTGLVARIALHKGTGASGTLTVSGHGPSALLAATMQCRSYEEGTSLSRVAGETLEGHSAEVIRAVMGDGADVPLPYTVQYNESDLAFLQRLCRRHGLWFYHDGKDLRIGRGGGRTVGGTYGTDVLSLDLSAALTGRGPDVGGHDWEGDQALGTPAGASPVTSNDYSGQVGDLSSRVLPKKGTYYHASGQHGHGGQSAMDRAVRVGAQATAAGRVTASGTSGLVGLRVGDTLELGGPGPGGKGGGRSFGNYDIIGVVHRFDNAGHYANDFKAVPAGTAHPPGSDAFQAPFAPDQRGRITDNADPQGLGRVRVQFPWQREISRCTPWIKVSSPYGGAGKGFYFVPEKGEEVLVGFEGGDPERPYVIGAGYSVSAKSGFADAGNNIKAIRTRSGHTIELNDTEGGETITINDKNGNGIHINTADNDIVISAHNNVTITAAENLTLKAKNIRFDAQEDMEMDIGKNKRESVGGKSQTSSKNTEENISENKKMTIGKKLEQTSGELTMHTSQGKMLLDSSGKITIQSKEGTDYGK
ncbi:MAG TPA: phage baseplate assembly protein V [Pricia sp.]|nr:phage baseplate assembly protein V [Pricia sp.]